jgi:lipase (class 3)
MYHPLVYLLDLCTYSYQLHNQTLIWPMDPYYEQWSSNWMERFRSSRRKEFISQVHKVALPSNYPRYRGPASLNGWTSNLDLDPIISDYFQINPWRPSVARPNKELEGWILYHTSPEITDRIATVHMACYDQGPGRPSPIVRRGLQRPADVPAGPGTDWLYCFEGGTGVIDKTVAAWSLLGLVLAREAPVHGNPTPYEIYIVFRGSRSGDPRMVTALSFGTGNPDWVTDMNVGLGQGAVQKIPEISATGSVSPGFAACVHTMLPTIMACLDDIQARKKYAPRRITVTGHSLGAALAVHFTSAIRLGTTYGWDKKPTSMPLAIRAWPWDAMELVSFALPVVGGKSFQHAFDTTVVSRRVFLEGDPITQTYRLLPVGYPHAIDPEKLDSTATTKVGPTWSPLRHEPFNIRYYLIKDLENSQLNNGPAPREEPWKIFKTFKEILAEQGAGEVSQILGTQFSIRLGQYLDVLGAIMSGHQEKQLISRLRKAILEKEIDALESWINEVASLYKESQELFQSDLADFFGLCLFLGLASKTTYRKAHDLLLRKPFVGLSLQ